MCSGDGNFLFTASKVHSPEKLVVGLNTDPSWSEGHLCLRATPPGSLTSLLEGVLRRDFKRIRRWRVCVSIADTLLPVRALNEVFVGEEDHSQ